MTPERWKQIDELFAAALDWAPDRRSKLLAEACAGDEKLRLEVESLLSAYEQAGTRVVAPGADAGARLLLDEDGGTLSGKPLRSPRTGQAPSSAAVDRVSGPLLARGDALDRYLVLDQLGRGGMGVVFSAYDPQLDRKVAVKLLRPGAFGQARASEGRARLLREAQALARLSHPNVIAVFDVGTFEEQVFIAMEYIDGSTLTRWLKEGEHPWREVLNIFIQAGKGLAAAHAAGLIHRDFKPDNVLVGSDGRVRVLDFGLARAGGESDRTETLPDVALASGNSPLESELTQPGLLMGTPAYMAPEQLKGLAVDARMDQFSFCVALYQGLYGELPFERAPSLASELKIKEAPKSSRVPGWLRRVILRGLRVDPKERYPSMDELLAELGRDPARARRRVLTLAPLALLIALAPLTYRYAKQQRNEPCQGAEQRFSGIWDEPRRRAMAAAFANSGLLHAPTALAEAQRAIDAYARRWVEMDVDACKATRVRGEQSEELLDLRMGCLGRRLEEVKSLAELFSHADAKLVSNALAAVRELTPLEGCANSVALRMPVRATDPEMRAKVEEIRRKLAGIKAMMDAGRYKDAAQSGAPLAAEAKSLRYRPLEAEALYLLGVAQARNGDAKTAEKTMREALLSAEAGRHDEMLATAATQMIWLLYEQAKYEQGLEWAQRAAATIERLGGDERLQAKLLVGEATVLQRFNRFDEAIAKHERALSIAKRIFGPEDREVPRILLNLGTAYGEQGQYAVAVEHYRRALELSERSIGAWHPDTGFALNNLGLNLRLLGKYEEALSYLDRAVKVREQALGSEHPHVATSLANIGDVLADQKSYSRALAYYERALPMYERGLGPEHPRLGWPLTGIGIAYLGLDRPKDAIGPLRRAAVLRDRQPIELVALAKTRFALARALRKARVSLGESRTLAEQARQAFAAAGEQVAVAEIDAWLKSKSGP